MAGSKKRMARARRGRTLIAQTFVALDNEQLTVTSVLEAPPACLARVRVFDVLRRIPHLDRDGAETVLRRSKVWPLTTMGNLTRDETQRILHALPPRVKR